MMRVLLAGREPGHKGDAKVRFWTRAWTSFTGFLGIVWLVAQRLVGVPASFSDFHVYGGRVHDADVVVRRIAAHQADPSTDPGSWAHDALRLGERVAMDFVQEAAEWTVLYTKEVSDPG
ncbi:MAG: hypothetical protein IPK85_00270 [Gemmatimonadetes bacterium]|nr:hypothetical protein [Gemmatimonadota bacterium]